VAQSQNPGTGQTSPKPVPGRCSLLSRWRWRSLRSRRPVEGRLSCRRPSRLRRRGQAWFEHPGLPASRSCGTRWVSGLRSAGGRGMVPAGSQLSGAVVQIGGGSV